MMLGWRIVFANLNKQHTLASFNQKQQESCLIYAWMIEIWTKRSIGRNVFLVTNPSWAWVMVIWLLWLIVHNGGVKYFLLHFKSFTLRMIRNEINRTLVENWLRRKVCFVVWCFHNSSFGWKSSSSQ